MDETIKPPTFEEFKKFCKKKSNKTYRFEEIKPRIKYLSKNFKKLLKENDIKPEITRALSTRYAYDNSDFTSWILYFGENKEKMNEARTKLASFIYEDKPVFNISGNGWGTGLTIMLNLSSKYD